MSYDPRTIAFMAEVLFPPIELKAPAVQEIHNALFKQPEISYQNFQIGPDGIHLTNTAQTPGAVSAASFAPDRLVIREELRATTVEDFATRLVNVGSIAFRTLGVQASVAQQFVVRSLISPRHTENSTEFIVGRMIGAPDEAWAQFGRPMQRAGLSFTFPQTGEHPQVYNIRIETWTQDPRSLWIENVGSFTGQVAAERLPDLSNLMFSTYKFATSQAMAFIGHFDRP